jgi:hypothetical protein
MIHYLNVASLASNTASRTSLIVAIAVVAAGAVATFTVGFLNFRTQRRGKEWPESQGNQQQRPALSSQMKDRCTKVICQPGGGNKAVRSGGIFVLEWIARELLQDERAKHTLQEYRVYAGHICSGFSTDSDSRLILQPNAHGPGT